MLEILIQSLVIACTFGTVLVVSGIALAIIAFLKKDWGTLVLTCTTVLVFLTLMSFFVIDLINNITLLFYTVNF